MIGSHGAQRASLRTRRPAARSPGSPSPPPSLAILGAARLGGRVDVEHQHRSASSVALTTTTTIDRPWYSTEQFYLGLVNCTRTGGWVLSNGTCRGYGSGHYSAYVRPLRISSASRTGLPAVREAARLSRASARHFADGDPGYRLRRAGLHALDLGREHRLP